MQMKNLCGLAGVVAAVGTLGTTAAAPVASADSSGPTVKVLARGLDEPKYLRPGPAGLYVAESGHGGRRCVKLVGVTGAPTQACTGATGAVVRVRGSGQVRTVVRGLASTIEQDNQEVEGPMAVAFRAGRIVVLNRGAFVGPTGRSSIPGPLGAQFGTLSLAPRRLGGRPATLSDLAAFAARNPQPAATLGGLPGELTYDSDAHDVVSYRDGYAVPDAGANDVVWRSPAGKLSVIARLPTVTETAPAGALGPGSPAQQIHAQAVSSSVAVGPDGQLYVGTLGGIPGLPGTSSVYRIAPGQPPVQVVSGLTRVSDIAFDAHGRLLILETKVGGTPAPASSPGALLRATLQNGTVVHATQLPVSGLSAPTALAVERDGSVDISNDTTTPGKGEILRVRGLG